MADIAVNFFKPNGKWYCRESVSADLALPSDDIIGTEAELAVYTENRRRFAEAVRERGLDDMIAVADDERYLLCPMMLRELEAFD